MDIYTAAAEVIRDVPVDRPVLGVRPGCNGAGNVHRFLRLHAKNLLTLRAI